ncbi:hypothetical protein WJX81_008484 [Elliptochloris bilobata]|uniref:Diacylglycerol kinase n=1 Tax=Elliptochloris bilobata TaxID=381761 RepID=A0AAW1RMH7_9CHLO
MAALQELRSADVVSQEETASEQASTRNKKLYRYATRRPAELEARPVDEEEYKAYRSATDLREPYRIPPAFLTATKKFRAPELPEAPLIAFINSRSGGRAGPKLAEILYRTLGHAQVFDLNEYRPGPVLRQIWANFMEREEAGDAMAKIIRSKFRILAAGGDGTVAWILKTVMELGLEPAPAVAVLPLGTGNDLSLSFGWGNTFQQAWIDRHITIYETLKRIGDAETRALDVWSVSITCGRDNAFKDLPHSLEAVDVEGASQPQSASEAVHKVKGLFWNYISVGIDAKAAYNFHSLREARPWAASGRLVNQAWYAYFSCSTGWFCAAPPVARKLKLKVRSAAGDWGEVRIPRSVKALVLLNIQSYAGGRDLWGLADTGSDARKGWRTPIFNDGLIEVVGLRGGWHTGVAMTGAFSRLHAKRLAQAAEVVIELRAQSRGGDESVAHMQLDGEPWAQKIPVNAAQPLLVHVAHAGTSRMLTNAARLSGIAPRITSLAARERQVSAMTLDMLKAGTAPPPPPPLSARRSNAASMAAAMPAATPGSALARGGSGGPAYFGSANGTPAADDSDATPVALEASGSVGHESNPSTGYQTLGSAFSAEAPEELPVVERVPGTAPIVDGSPVSRPGSARSALSRPSSGPPNSARRSSLFRRSPATPERGGGAAAAAALAAENGGQNGGLHGRHVSFDGVENIPPTSPPRQ